MRDWNNTRARAQLGLEAVKTAAAAAAMQTGQDERQLLSLGHQVLARALAEHDPGRTPFLAFLRQRLSWAFRSEQRKQQRRRGALERYGVEEQSWGTNDLDERAASPVATPEEHLDAKQRASAVATAVEALEEPDRTLVRQHYFHGRSFREIAHEIGITPTVALRARGRAFGKLRRALREPTVPRHPLRKARLPPRPEPMARFALSCSGVPKSLPPASLAPPSSR